MKILLIIIGSGLILIGLFLTFGITVYSLKEQDNDVLYAYCISAGMIVSGVYSIVKGRQITSKESEHTI
jgi:uncharacterized membrane protein